MNKNSKSWQSPSLGRDMELLVYGDTGTPVLALPTRGGSCSQWEEKGMIDTLTDQIENGFNQVYCIDSVDDESFFNEKIKPSRRLMRQQQYESYVVDEVVPFIQDHSSNDFIIIAGVDMGGYHAINLSLKHPSQFDKAIGISGIYDIKPMFDDFEGDGLYYNNPVAYLPNLNKPMLLGKIQEIDFRLASYANDSRREQTDRMADTLRMKMVDPQLDIWDTESDDEWEIWRQIIQVHII